LLETIAGIPGGSPDGSGGTGGADLSAETLRPTNCEALRLSSWYDGVFLSLRSGFWGGGCGIAKSQTGLETWRVGERGVHSFCWFGSSVKRGTRSSDASSNVRPGSCVTIWAIGVLGSGFSDKEEDRVAVDIVRLNGDDFSGAGEGFFDNLLKSDEGFPGIEEPAECRD
jgi:hypothetical protein